MFHVVSILFLAFCFFLPGAAYADIILPEEEVCDSRAEGDECSTEEIRTGICAAAQRCRLDYSELDENGEPTTSCSPSLICEAVEGNVEVEDEVTDDGCSSTGHQPYIPVLSLLVGVALLGLVRRSRSREA